MIRILIVDDHVLFREGLSAIIGQQADIKVVGLAGSVREAVEAARQLRPDIILMDFTLPDGTGAEATRQIIQENSAIKVVFLTMSDSDDDMLAAVRSGGVGYLLKNMTPSKLVDALRSVQQGESALSRSMTLRVMEELVRSKAPDPAGDPALGKLTNREREILAELAAGKSNQEIADKLVLSVNTVKYHVHSILDKLNLEDRKDAERFARQHGMN